jgi:[ribosomal protein S18]-alanine N-acetyltransferase
VTTRVATLADVDALVALHASGFEAGWDTASFLEFLQNEMVLVSGVPPTGLVIVRRTLDEAEIMTLVVDPRARRAGQGGDLLKDALDRVNLCGAKTVFLEVASDNGAAIALYRKAGFVHIGLRKAYYARQSGSAVDAVVMSKSLTTPGKCSQ